MAARLDCSTRGRCAWTRSSAAAAPARRLPPSAAWLVVVVPAVGTAIRVATTQPRDAQASRVGPTLHDAPEWDWAHSGVARGGGERWIYGLDGSASTLLEVSAGNGTLVHRFAVGAGPDPFIVVDADGLWITESAWGGSSCATACTLWHVAPGSNRLVAVRTLGVRTQWLMASGHSIYADVLTSVRGAGFRQTIWRLDGAQANIAYTTPATLLPSTDFASLTGYVVVGNADAGLLHDHPTRERHDPHRGRRLRHGRAGTGRADRPADGTTELRRDAAAQRGRERSRLPPLRAPGRLGRRLALPPGRAVGRHPRLPAVVRSHAVIPTPRAALGARADSRGLAGSARHAGTAPPGRRA